MLQYKKNAVGHVKWILKHYATARTNYVECLSCKYYSDINCDFTLTLRDLDISGFTTLGHMANPSVFRIHRYRILIVFFFQPIRTVVLLELWPVAMHLGKSISAVFTGDSTGLSWSRGSFYLNKISMASVGLFGRNKTYFLVFSREKTIVGEIWKVLWVGNQKTKKIKIEN